jgi:hypothetical protein
MMDTEFPSQRVFEAVASALDDPKKLDYDTKTAIQVLCHVYGPEVASTFLEMIDSESATLRDRA